GPGSAGAPPDARAPARRAYDLSRLAGGAAQRGLGPRRPAPPGQFRERLTSCAPLQGAGPVQTRRWQRLGDLSEVASGKPRGGPLDGCIPSGAHALVASFRDGKNVRRCQLRPPRIERRGGRILDAELY